MKLRRGDIVLVLFPDSNLQTAKRRPVLVVQVDDLRSGLAQTVVAMITSNTARAGHPSRVVASLASPHGVRSGLKTDSVIMTDNLATILEGEIDRVIGTWGDMAAVDAALRHTLALTGPIARFPWIGARGMIRRVAPVAQLDRASAF